MEDLTGKVAWITGGGTGIGQAGAFALAGAGVKVILSGRRPEPLVETVRRIQDQGGQASAEPLDVTDAEAVQALAGRIQRQDRRIDFLVNSAGINIPDRSWERVSPEKWDEVIDIDLNGAFYCIHAVLPLMRQQHEGLIINISSMAGHVVSPLTGPAYSAAKHAMIALNTSVNVEEWRNGIRACVICPGEVDTPILEKRPIPVSDEDKATLLRPEDLGETILFAARMPAHACVNEIQINPTHRRGVRPRV
ncbi:MAG: SDR family oxidoreductase [Deltaproteobacteria bacterium]|nr:SDR family oxidoreductase [Deltaproteobacteria bacterium]